MTAEAGADPEVELEDQYPPDGWYLNIIVSRVGSRGGSSVDELQAGAERMAVEARDAGYLDAEVWPAPGVPQVCSGVPCEMVGPPPGENAVVVLQAVPGPDVARGFTAEEFTAFEQGPLTEVSQAARDAGVENAFVSWLAFSQLEGIPVDIEVP